MARPELMSLTIAEAAAQIKARTLSPVELIEACLERIESVEPQVHAFVTVCGDEAMAAARRAEREIAGGRYRGPMHGIPYAVKDIFASKGVRTTAGSRLLEDNVTDYDSTAIARMNRAGAVLVGKNNCAEFASGGESSSFKGPVHNPWKLGHTSGGSSSGSCASVAAGMVLAGVGSCTGGSIRQPASHTNVVGLKPTYGLVSRYGVFPLSWSLDHAGPLGKTAVDTALILQALAGFDALDPSSVRAGRVDYSAGLVEGLQGVRVGRAPGTQRQRRRRGCRAGAGGHRRPRRPGGDGGGGGGAGDRRIRHGGGQRHHLERDGPGARSLGGPHSPLLGRRPREESLLGR